MLGFNRPVAEKALDQILKANGGSLPVDQLIKNALKVL
jgi:Holliday junction resolvasome RuvABC DNA-binding subunit